MKLAGSGWDYRHATLIIYVSEDGIKRCESLLIFKGSTRTEIARIEREMTQYDSEVIVQWDPKA